MRHSNSFVVASTALLTRLMISSSEVSRVLERLDIVGASQDGTCCG